jgi:hypothetical protein
LTTRDNQIAEIKRGNNNLRFDRLKECYDKVAEAYEVESVVEKLTTIRKEADRSPADFRVITSQESREITAFNDETFYWDLYCKDLGRSIAIGERRYIFEGLQETSPQGKPADLGDDPFKAIARIGTKMLEDGYSPDILCAPSEFMVTAAVHPWFDYDHEANQEFIKIPDGPKLKLFWSSKYAPLREAVIFDTRRTLWKVKLDPDTQGRLTVAIGEPKERPNTVVFLAETVAKFEILDRISVCSFPIRDT